MLTFILLMQYNPSLSKTACKLPFYVDNRGSWQNALGSQSILVAASRLRKEGKEMTRVQQVNEVLGPFSCPHDNIIAQMSMITVSS